MTDSLLLRHAIQQKKLTIEQLAALLKMPEKVLNDKIDNVIEFTANEIAAIIELLEINSSWYKRAVFFSDFKRKPSWRK